MPNAFDPYRDALVVENQTVWPEEYEDWSRADKSRVEALLHASPREAAELDYREVNLSRYQPGPYRSADHDALVVGLNSAWIELGVRGATAAAPVVQLQHQEGHLVWSAAVQGPFRIELYDAQGRHLATTTPHVGVVMHPTNGMAGQLVLWRARCAGDAVRPGACGGGPLTYRGV